MTARIMQIVAHEDDDLLFMNPDISHAIQSGVPTLTCYLTAGEISGNGPTPGARARSRQLGMKAAYASMAGVSDPVWDGDAQTFAGKQVEHYSLQGHPGVELVFVNLPDSGMNALYAGTGKQTVVPDGGVVTTSFTYARADVVAVLTALLSSYQPTLLRIQDPVPDPRHTPGPEHLDHVATAKFATDAAHAYSDQLMVINHRCYNIGGSPVNLSPDLAAEKRDTFGLYTPFDADANDFGWTARMYHRWPRGCVWVGANQDGRLQLFVARGGAVLTYWQNLGDAWVGPQILGGAGGPIAPVVAVGNNADGRLQIFAHRLTDHHIITTYQTEINGGWSPGWVDLGNPNGTNPGYDQVGMPAVANNADGRMEVFVKNGGGGVSTKYQTQVNGVWSAGWTDMGGTEVEDGLTAVTNPGGVIELFAWTTSAILHWYQTAPNAVFVMNPFFPYLAPASPPLALLASDGTIMVAYRVADTGMLAVSRQVEPNGGWEPDPVILFGQAGLGGASGVCAPPGAEGRVTLLGRKDDGAFATATQKAPGGDMDPWDALDGVRLIDLPTAALDRSGAIVLAGIGEDGVVYLRRQASPGIGQPFGAWQPLP